MMHRLFLCSTWFVLTIFTVATNLSLLYITQQKALLVVRPHLSSLTSPSQNNATGGSVRGISSVIDTADARETIIASFLERYKSPLQPYDYFGRFIVQTADKYGVDYRLIPAIMMQESNLCKVIPPGSYNCLGFGVHSQGTLGFKSYEGSIDRATRELKANYIDQGLTTPELIMKKYTPRSNGSWAQSVNQWIAEMEYNSHAKGKSEKSDADLTQYAQ